MDEDLEKKYGNEKKAQISFRKLMDFIGCGEEAEILLNKKKYKIGVKLNNKEIGVDNYYVNKEKFCDKKSFLNFIYQDSSIQLNDNSIITLLSIGNGVTVDASWFNVDKNTNIQKSETDKFVLFKNIVVRFCATWFVLILVTLLLIKDKHYLKLEQIVTILFGILIYIITYLPKNINRLKLLIKHKKSQVNEIEKIKRELEKDNCFGDVYLLENHLVKIEKHYFETIKYEDILWIFKEVYYSRRGSKSQEYNSWWGFKNYGEFIFITKDKKIHKMGYISKEQIFRDKILGKNPDILFGRMNAVTKKAKQLHNLNINILDFKIRLCDYIKFLSVLFILYWIYWLVL